MQQPSHTSQPNFDNEIHDVSKKARQGTPRQDTSHTLRSRRAGNAWPAVGCDCRLTEVEGVKAAFCGDDEGFRDGGGGRCDGGGA
eukprot:6207658-Pleurochrysis_carterae.AAC.1